MAYQTGKNIVVAYKPETTLGVAVTGGSGYQFRPNASQGLKLQRATILPGEIRADGKTSMGRLGSKQVTGGYVGDISVGTFDTLIEAVFRSTMVAAQTITQATATLTSITTNATSIIAAAGSWITAGMRVGDVFRLTNHSTSANNNKNLRVTAVTTLTLSVAEALVTDSVADSSFTMVIAKKCYQGTSPTNRSFTIEQYNQDLDLSERAVGCRVSSMKISGQPDQMATIEFGFVGTDLSGLASGASPNFTSPTLTTGDGLTMVDATIRLNGSDIATLTGVEINLDLNAAIQPVVGSTTSPDVFCNNAVVNGSISGLRTDLSNLTLFTGETEFELSILMVENESEPKDFIYIHIPRVKLTGVDTSFGNDGALIETLPFIVGTKGTATGYDDTMIKFATSAA